jgi:hypothetical protein
MLNVANRMPGKVPTMTTTDPDDSGGTPTDRLREALRRSASALKAGSVSFALAGSYALWVYGAPENSHDVDLLDRAEFHHVLGLQIPVLPPTEVISAKLRAMSERYCDFGQLLPPVRAVRERLDWARLRNEANGNAFARAFLFLVAELDIGPTGEDRAP